MNDVRELLGRAAEGAGHPGLTTDAVYARAGRVRRRRRAAVSGAALAVVAAGVVAFPGFAAGPGTERTSVAAPAEKSGKEDRAGRLTALLPSGVGTVEQVSLAVLIKNATPEQAKETYVGPLDGQYSVRRDGGVGFLTLSYTHRAQVARKSPDFDPAADLCVVRGKEPPRVDCVREELPDGRILTIWHDSMDYGDGTPQWGPEFTARLVLKDGSLLAARSSTGYEGDRSQGPLLESPPLDRTQLRDLLLRPELVPAGGTAK
ncbi:MULTISPECIES: hypothetical protein [unclassified Streptomyces]|uniref:hypothetical protein n=1 Tax=unclassified Streptomyces TaxID=2593676 RepID=UPI00093E1B26|nr:hypothetical protein [Streptomyces sp. CB02058]OKI98154.1 hypothetical protein AMK10_04980 [Streptomyces sp. CB02058]